MVMVTHADRRDAKGFHSLWVELGIEFFVSCLW